MASPTESLDTALEPTRRFDPLWRESRAVLLGYWGIHAACLLVFFTEPSAANVTLLLGSVVVRMFGITAGYHRYFAHKTYRTGRVFQFVLALLGCSALQKGPLWWAAGHRRHHVFSDQEGDLHSPRDGFYWAHQGWILSPRWLETEYERIGDFAAYPELVWLNRWHLVPPLGFGVLCFLLGGFDALIWGFVLGTVALWHQTYLVNSVAHVWGSRRYDTPDTSRNNWLVALLTLGEGWHNNHHRFMASARQGFFWWELDPTYYALRGLAKLGIVRDLREPPRALLEQGSRPVRPS
jgi:stearoyl-CoA desaturase (delta-9 desaturase)